MCIMFRDKWIIRFFKFPFCGDFRLHLHKMVQEISRNITRAENFRRHIFWNSLMLADIDIACLLNGWKHWIVIRRSCTNLKIKAKQDTDTNKSKPLETSTWATLVCSTQSPNLVSNIPHFPQVGLCEAPGGMSRVKLWTCVRNSQSSYFCPCLLYPQYTKYRPPKWRVLHKNRRKYWKEKPVF